MSGGRPPHAVDVLVQRLDADLPLPAYAHPGDAGLDLFLVDLTDAEDAGEAMLLLMLLD